MKFFKIASLLALSIVTLLIGSNISHAETTSSQCYYWDTEPNNTIDSATKLCQGDQINGSLPQNDVDYFQFNIQSYGDLTLKGWAQGGGLGFSLLDSSSNPINGTYTKDSIGNDVGIFYPAVDKGTYYVKVDRIGDPSQNGAYYQILINMVNKVKPAPTPPYTGWKIYGGHWQFLQNDKVVFTTGWLYYNNQWFYLKNCIRQESWVFVNNKWYYLAPGTGVMQTGWILYGGKWYYLDPINGDMKTGWLWYKNNWYYLNENGDMATGQVYTGGKMYYLYSNGVMAHDIKIGSYRLGHDGAWIH